MSPVRREPLQIVRECWNSEIPNWVDLWVVPPLSAQNSASSLLGWGKCIEEALKCDVCVQYFMSVGPQHVTRSPCGVLGRLKSILRAVRIGSRLHIASEIHGRSICSTTSVGKSLDTMIERNIVALRRGNYAPVVVIKASSAGTNRSVG